jgi:hypothetical protein
MLAATGSTITHGHVSSSVGHLVVGHDDVSATAAGGDAGEPGRPERGPRRCRRLGEQRVAVAVVVAGELHDLGPAGVPRARRMADMVASVPLDTSRTFSTDGTRSQISSASSTSRSVGAP